MGGAGACDLMCISRVVWWAVWVGFEQVRGGGGSRQRLEGWEPHCRTWLTALLPHPSSQTLKHPVPHIFKHVQVSAIHLHPDLFTVDNDLLTPTFKLKRPQAKAAFQAAIDAMYASLPSGAGGH